MRLPPAQSGPYLLPPKGIIDSDHVVREPKHGSSLEIKEWQAIINFLKSLPTKNKDGVTMLEMNERSMENRSISGSLNSDGKASVVPETRFSLGRVVLWTSNNS